MTNFTCPHCGRRAITERTDLERVNINGEDWYFLAVTANEERHIDQRLCCEACYARAGVNRSKPGDDPDDPPHPYGTRYHREVRLAHPVGQRPFGQE